MAERQYDRAARLFGAAEAQRIRSGLVPASRRSSRHAGKILAAAPDFTGPALDTARKEGRMLGLEAATALAVDAHGDVET